MPLIILLIFIAVPVVEIAVIIEVGGILGVWTTIAAIFATAILGTALLRHQGLATLQKAQNNLNAGIMPMAEVFDGVCLLLAGVLLLTPGFVTDGIGLSLFLPPVRYLLKKTMGRAFVLKTATSFSATANPGAPHPKGDDSSPKGDFIEGDFTDITDNEPPKPLP